MNTEQKEKRLMEAFTLYEKGESLATLQRIFPDIAVELDQMAEAEQLLKEGKKAMLPSQELGRKIVAALALRAQQKHSLFMSSLWRLAAPVGIAALALMFVLAGRQTVSPTPAVTEQAGTFAVRTAAPMMAKNADMSLTAVQAPEPAAPKTDHLYLWQMNALGLLVILCAVVFFKHKQARRR